MRRARSTPAGADSVLPLYPHASDLSALLPKVHRPKPDRIAPRPPLRLTTEVGRHEGTVVVTVHGEVDIPAAEALGRILSDLIDGQGNLSVLVDLHDATAADPDCLCVFTDAAERARRRGGMVELSEHD